MRCSDRRQRQLRRKARGAAGRGAAELVLHDVVHARHLLAPPPRAAAAARPARRATPPAASSGCGRGSSAPPGSASAAAAPADQRVEVVGERRRSRAGIACPRPRPARRARCGGSPARRARSGARPQRSSSVCDASSSSGGAAQPAPQRALEDARPRGRTRPCLPAPKAPAAPPARAGPVDAVVRTGQELAGRWRGQRFIAPLPDGQVAQERRRMCRASRPSAIARRASTLTICAYRPEPGSDRRGSANDGGHDQRALARRARPRPAAGKRALQAGETRRRARCPHGRCCTAQPAPAERPAARARPPDQAGTDGLGRTSSKHETVAASAQRLDGRQRAVADRACAAAGRSAPPARCCPGLRRAGTGSRTAPACSPPARVRAPGIRACGTRRWSAPSAAPFRRRPGQRSRCSAGPARARRMSP